MVMGMDKGAKKNHKYKFYWIEGGGGKGMDGCINRQTDPEAAGKVDSEI